MNYFTILNNPVVNILLCTFWHFGIFFWTCVEVLASPRSLFEFPVRAGSKNVQFWGAFVTEYQIAPPKVFQFITPPAIWEYESSGILIAKINSIILVWSLILNQISELLLVVKILRIWHIMDIILCHVSFVDPSKINCFVVCWWYLDYLFSASFKTI